MTDTPTFRPDPPARPAGPPTAGGPPESDPAAVARAERFVASLPVASDPSRRHATYAAVGMALMLVGLVTAIVAVLLSQASDNPLDQSTQTSLGIAGLAAVGVGGAVFLRYSLGTLLRYWLLRMTDEQHRRG